ncbi:helix-turn-helix domain-containing protein [Streptomyces sp. NPDC048191]|uniref:ArsR/SmtB family transcription factor n=1 Tax=Streptomyces sp. NPDC048191 TaxID=3155484 RepID=UPI0033E708E8
MSKGNTAKTGVTGDDLVQVMAALSNPHRMRVVAAVARQRNYVSRLARELGISRALLQIHLRKLESAGLVSARLELSEDGKAMKFYETTPFAFHITPQSIATAAETLHFEGASDGESNQKEQL